MFYKCFVVYTMNLRAFLIIKRTEYCFPLQRGLAVWDCVLSEVRNEDLYTHII